MKKSIFVLFALVLSTGLMTAQDVKKTSEAVFGKTTHDFGKVAESNKSVSIDFTFKNTGVRPGVSSM